MVLSWADNHEISVNGNTCRLSEGLPCNCIPRVTLSKNVERVSTLTEKQRCKLAAFRLNPRNQYRAEITHANSCAMHRSKGCDCEEDIEFKGETALAAEVVTSAISEQTRANQGASATLREQTAARKVEFSRGNQGQITSAKIRDA